ncbi:MAG: phage holin family protein [Herpetosiphon sp.]
MTRFVTQLVATAAALFVAVRVVPGMHLDTALTPLHAVTNLGLITIIFGLVNAVVRPFVKASTCVLNVLTLGLFSFVVNALMLYLTSILAQHYQLGFQIDTPLAALEGAIIIGAVSFVVGFLLPGN